MRAFFSLSLSLAFGVGSLLVACGGSSTSVSPGGADSGPSPEAGADTSPTPTPDGGVVDTGTDPAPDAASPEAGTGPITITAPNDTWTWVNIPGAVCGNGSPTGIGVNPHAGATHLLIYLQGGGACLDGSTCWGSSPTATDMTGYAASDFASDPTKDLTIFSRSSSVGNPWDDADLVFVPYCTGDVHFGTAMTTFTVQGVNNNQPIPTYFYGAKNIAADVASLAQSFKSVNHVWLLGVSAGGFGTFLNEPTVATAFSGIPVDIVDDSGPAVPLPDGVSVSFLPWGVQIPAGCTGCTGMPDVYAYDRKTYPNTKFAFLTYQTDSTLPLFFMVSDSMFATEIQTFISSMTDPNAKSFQAESTGHVVLLEQDTTAAPFILPWLTQMVNDDPAWANVMH